MSSGGLVAPSSRRASLRPSLRQATLILPRTGERVKRQVTLRGPALSDWEVDGSNGDETPLLGEPVPGRPNSFRRARHTFQRLLVDHAKRFWVFATSKTGQDILKCSLAYFLGSLATIVIPIARLLGRQDGKHVVATITVYFHPARSQGSMHEATILALIAFLYSMFLSVTSMAVSVFFKNCDLLPLGHAIVLIVFVGGGLGLVGWLKQRFNDPLVNIACSLTALATISILTKEGAVQAATFSDDKIAQIAKMVLLGIVITNFVSLTFRPVSARRELRKSFIKTTDAFGEMLAIITRSFLNGSEDELSHEPSKAASERYRTVFDALTKNLQEAKLEHYALGTETEYHIESKLVKCMQRLAQDIGGLRSAATTQFSLLANKTDKDSISSITSSHDSVTPTPPQVISPLVSPSRTFPRLSAIDEVPEELVGYESDEQGRSAGETPPRRSKEYSENSDAASTLQSHRTEFSSLPSAASSAEIFARFIKYLGPSMKSLTYTLREILDELPFSSGPDSHVAFNSHFSSSLDEATELYSKARCEALKLIYRSKDLQKTRSAEIEADYEEVAASCGHFSFSLLDFAGEMKIYLGILEELAAEIDRTPRRRSWRWLHFWHREPNKDNQAKYDSNENAALQTSLLEEAMGGQLPRDIVIPLKRRASVVTFEATRKQTIFFRLYEAFRDFRRDDVKYAIKVGVGAALYALPSFLSATRPFYSHWRGEWGLLSYMLVCSMTVGASNTTGYQRFMGTCMGAVCAIAAWSISQGNPYVLATLGWIMSLAGFYVILAQGKGPMGRFILLTYNLSVLYAYSLSVQDDDNDDDEGGTEPLIFEITLHRVTAVLSGCIWGLLITRVIWRISARRKIKDGLSLLWLRMGLIWKRDPLSTLLEGESPNTYMNLREELELQWFLTRLDSLRKSAASEFEFRGPFPSVEFGEILESTGRMLDAFHSMNVIILKDLNASRGEVDILRYTERERGQLCARISHLFQVLASSMKLEYPLNDALPNTDHARDRLLTKIFAFRKRSQFSPIPDEDYALLYAYALVTGLISDEIANVSMKIERLFGIFDEDMLKLQ